MSGRRWRQRTVPALAIAAIALGLLVWLHGPLLRVLAVFERPLAAAGSWITGSASRWCEGLLSPGFDVTELEAQRNAFAVESAELTRLQEENTILREQLGFIERRQLQAVSAAIVQRTAGPTAAEFVIDRGGEDGVVVGSPVIVSDGLLIGKVSGITAASATVTLLTDPASATAVTLLNETRTIGLAEGITGTLIAVQYIPNEERIAVNDLVVTSGLEEGMPSGLIVGVVNAVESDPTAPFQSAIVEPLVDVRRYHMVSVLVQN